MVARWVWFVMMIAVGIEFALGVACLVLVPTGRPDQWLPPQSKGVYIAHAAIGGLLGIGALAIRAALAPRVEVRATRLHGPASSV